MTGLLYLGCLACYSLNRRPVVVLKEILPLAGSLSTTLIETVAGYVKWGRPEGPVGSVRLPSKPRLRIQLGAFLTQLELKDV